MVSISLDISVRGAPEPASGAANAPAAKRDRQGRYRNRRVMMQ